MRLMKEGKDLKDIRAYIDAEYSKYGPSTNTEPIGEHQGPYNEQLETCGGTGDGVAGALNLETLSPATVSETQNN